MDLTVTPLFTYTLAVTIKLATAEKGGVTVTSTITLHQSPDSNSTWATWGASGCGSNPNCQILLNMPQGTDITFPYSFMAKIASSGYASDSLVSAYGNAATSDTINARAVTFVEGTAGALVKLNSGRVINLVGCLDAYYVPTSGFTTIQNILKVGGTNGRLNIKGGVKIKQ